MTTIKLLTLIFLLFLQWGTVRATENADVLAQLSAEDTAKPLQLIIKGRLAQTDFEVAELFSQAILHQYRLYIAGAYRSSFSEVELRQIVNFMNTEAGKKFRAVSSNTAFVLATEPARVRQLLVASCASAEAALSPEKMQLLRSTFCM